MALIVSHVHKDFSTASGPLSILRDCSLRLDAGESLSIVGPSGSGKSTLLNILGTLEPATSGRVELDEIDVFSLSSKELPEFRRRKIGFVFQDHHLLPQCSALENVLVPFLAEGRIRPEQTDQGVALLERVGLADRLDHRPGELSGGERQRVAIARALIYRPSLLLADEPTGNLDRESATQIGDLLLELSGESMLLLVTHDPVLAARTSRQTRLVDGTLVGEDSDPATT